MKKIVLNSNYQKIIQVWFWDKAELPEFKNDKIDLLEFKEARFNINGSLKPFINGIIDLTKSENVIVNSIHKDFKYEARRAKKENIQAYVVNPISSKLFDEAYKLYQKFSALKKISIIDKKYLINYLSTGSLAITCAQYNDKIIQYHIYFRDFDEIILLASFPNISISDLPDKYYGWSNRLLHMEDILQFKRESIKKYNLGGTGNPGSRGNENIINFKMEMNPQKCEYFNGIIYLSAKAKLIKTIKSFLRN